MKFLKLWLVVVIAVNGISVHGFAITNSVLITNTRNTTPKCTKMGSECADDCRTLLVCSSFSTDPLFIQTCEAQKQYCVNGACTSTAGLCIPGGGSDGSTFTCTDKGIFPDPTDCTQFHICDAVGVAEDHRCNTGFVFDSKLKMCQLGKTPCTKISCSKASEGSEANTFIAYTSNPVYYAFCKHDDTGFEAIMLKCLYDEFEEFDVKSKQCQFKCRAKGIFQNPADCGESYSCTGANAQPVLAKCPPGWVFDGASCNSDVSKCKHKPKESNVGGDDLSESKPVAGAVSDLFDNLKDDIIEQICESSSDKATCIRDTSVTAKDYRERSVGDVTTYFVSVTATVASTNEVYHVKLISEPPSRKEVEGVAGPKNDDAEIEPF